MLIFLKLCCCLILIIFVFDIFKIVKKWVIICLIGLENVNRLKKLKWFLFFNFDVNCFVVCWMVNVFFWILIDLGVFNLILFLIFW